MHVLQVVTEMLRLSEAPLSSTTAGAGGVEAGECEEEVRLCMLLPHFDHFFAQLVQADAAYALQCLDQYIRHLR